MEIKEKLDLCRLSEEDAKEALYEIKEQTVYKCSSNCPFMLDSTEYCTGRELDICRHETQENLKYIVEKYKKKYVEA